jgi:hypothetical protein
MLRIEIDPNIRTNVSWTFVGFEDVHNEEELKPGDEVEVFESESGLHGPGKIEHIDFEAELVYIRVNWNRLTI